MRDWFGIALIALAALTLIAVVVWQVYSVALT
jgi:hypothetical protein